jgi:hypothetical protein
LSTPHKFSHLEKSKHSNDATVTACQRLRKAWWNATLERTSKSVQPSPPWHLVEKQVPAKPPVTMQRNQEQNPLEAMSQQMSQVGIEHSQESERGTREGIRPKAASKARIAPQNTNGCKETAAADGTRTNKNRKTIAQQMDQDDKHAWLIQETWLTGNFRVETQGTTFFHHGLEEATCNRGRGGGTRN